MGVLTDLVDSLFNAIVGVLTGKPVSVAAPDTPIIPKTKPTADPIQPVYVSTVEPSNGLNTWQQSQPTPPTADPSQIPSVNVNQTAPPYPDYPLYYGTYGTAHLPKIGGTVYLRVFVKPSDLPPTLSANYMYFEGFTVEFEGGTAITDSGGTALVEGRDILPYNEYFVRVSKAGYHPKSAPISFAADDTNYQGKTYPVIVPIERRST